ncbi:MAG: hypothetical protein ACPG4Z_02925 [Chitinophagales bacterium]
MKYCRFLLLSVFLLFLFIPSFSQDNKIEVSHLSTINFKKKNKGKMYFFVGWNWARYTASDIHFQGEGHDFTLHNVKAEDRPSPFSANMYFNPVKWSVPQTNLKIGYFFHDNWNIAFGMDHMKYVMINDQTVTIDGTIALDNVYDKEYENEEIVLTDYFLEYEHTDGLNYVHFEINRFDRILETRWFDINMTEGFSVGVLYPRSDVNLLNQGERDKYHLSGYGLGLKAAANLTFFNYFFIQSEAKGGFIHLPDVKTTPNGSDKASQKFFYFQHNFLIGAVFPILRKEKRL